MYNLKIIDNRDGTHVILLKLTKDQILPMIQGFEHLRKSLEKDYKRENYKFYYRRIDCILRKNYKFYYRRIDCAIKDILSILEILGYTDIIEQLDSEQSEQEYWGNVRALEVIEGFYNDTQVTSTGPVDHTPENNNRPPSVIKR